MADNHNPNSSIQSVSIGALKAIKNSSREISVGEVEITRLANATPYSANDNISATVAVKQKEEITFTGTSGTLNINVAGLTLLATFIVDIGTTAINFESAHVLALAAVGVTLTRALEVIVLEASVAGVPFASSTVSKLTANLDAAVVVTQANVTNVASKITLPQIRFESGNILRVIAKTNMPLFAGKTITVRLWKTRNAIIDDDNVVATDTYSNELIGDTAILFGAASSNICRGESSASIRRNFLASGDQIIVTMIATEAITPASGGKLKLQIITE